MIQNSEYKETPIGRIPKEWEVVRLGDEKIAEIRGNKTINKFERVAFIPMELVPDSGIFARYEIRSMKEVKSFTYCERGDLLLAKITPSLENGKQGIVPEGVPNGFALATTEVFPISCKKSIDKLFLFYILKFTKFRNKIIHSMIGTTGRQRASKDSIKNLKIPLPPLPEQKKIAEILSTVDKAIETVDTAIAETERLKKGMMQELLSKGIGHKEFKDTKIGRIPKEWEVVRLGEICKQRNQIILPSGKGKYKFIGLEHITSGETKLCAYEFDMNIKSSKFKFYAGDILYGKLRPYLDKAILAEFDGICSTDLLVLTSAKDRIYAEFLIYVIHSKKFIQYAISTTSGTNYPRTSWKAISKFMFGLPLPPEQKKIAEILSTVDKKLELERERKKKLERIKRGLMNDLLTGKRRVKVDAIH